MENPKRSRFWEEKAVKELISMGNMILVDCDAGAFGGKDLDGYDIIKTYRFLTNSQDIADRVNKRLNQAKRQECRPLEGKNVTFSQVYPDKLVDAIMKGLQAEARRRAPTRFDTHEVMVAEPVEDFTAWGQILEEVRKIFMKSTTKAMNLEQGTELFKKISRLIPWELTRVQVAVTPMARRLPRDINYSHRGAVLLLLDGKMMIEVEDVRQVQFPKARFENPISAAIFFYGFTEEDAPQGQPAPEDPLLPVVGLRTDITFPGIPLNVSKEVRASVARLHVNAGHPSKQELKRLLAAHGALNLPVATALEHIKWQFAERLQADLVYIRDRRLLSRAPNHVLDVLRQIWLGPFGYPLQIEVDPDGAFQKEFTEQLESAGVHIKTIPAEAHWRIGAVERRNALLRTVVVDENAVTSGEALDWVITAATQRALLRKTAPNVSDAKAILPRAMAAYWRWTKKAAGKKRGGYVLGRLVHHDSDGKSAWVHSNGGLVQVTHEQLRPAYGLEDWAPGPEDIRALKDENLDPEIDAMGVEEPTPLEQQQMGALPQPEGSIPTAMTDDGHSSIPDAGDMQVTRMTKHNRPWTTLITTWDETTFKEYESWRSWGTITPLDDKEADEVLKCPTLRRRVIPSRNACRDKNRGAGPSVAAKCRTVVLGCLDLDLSQLDRSSPTPTKFAELTVIQVAASGLCRQVELTGMEWGLWGGDVATAFLQDARELPLFLRPPRDELQRRAKSFPHRLYSIEGNLYGFASAPKTWIKHVVRTLTVAQFLTHRLDHMCFYKRCSRGYLQVILIVHVDDFLVAFRKDYNMDELLGMFTWGNKDVIKVTQTEFIKEMECGSIKRGRLTAESLNAEERAEFKSVSGSLQWLGGQSRPDLCALTSLSNKGSDTKPTDLRDVLEGIKVAKETMTDGLTFQANSMDQCVDRMVYANYFLSE
ncbi:unnamed protein product, partial [Effrenium voratum]